MSTDISAGLYESMSKPSLPPLQFAVLSVLASESMPGRDLRKRLAEFGFEKRGPAFYRLMSRVEQAGLVQGWYEQEVVDGQIVRERHYRATAAGRRARERTARLFERLISEFREVTGHA